MIALFLRLGHFEWVIAVKNMLAQTTTALTADSWLRNHEAGEKQR